MAMQILMHMWVQPLAGKILNSQEHAGCGIPLLGNWDKIIEPGVKTKIYFE
jgi:hypothetical protein